MLFPTKEFFFEPMVGIASPALVYLYLKRVKHSYKWGKYDPYFYLF